MTAYFRFTPSVGYVMGGFCYTLIYGLLKIKFIHYQFFCKFEIKTVDFYFILDLGMCLF